MSLVLSGCCGGAGVGMTLICCCYDTGVDKITESGRCVHMGMGTGGVWTMPIFNQAYQPITTRYDNEGKYSTTCHFVSDILGREFCSRQHGNV